MTTYAINGLGRIGKLALRPLLESGAQIAFLNDALGDPEMHAHLLEFDTVQKKVIVSAPVKDGNAANIVYGVNNHDYDADSQNIITAASCTTNCIAPVVKVIHENLGIKHGSITSIHDVTNTQTIVDRPAKDLRRARSALNSLIPTTTARSTIVDAPSTMVVNGTQVKVYAWYDNEWGYANRLIDVARMVGDAL